MRELLIRYLLGELDEVEQQRLEERLEKSPQWRRELAYLQSCFSSAEQADLSGAEPPPGLAKRTAGRVSDYACDALFSNEPPEDRPSPSAAAAVVEAPAGAPRWSLADVSVAAGVCLAVSALLLPALHDSRDATRRRDCQNNQRQIGVLLANYAAQHGGYYPRVAPDENAGIYVLRLVDQGYVTPDEMARLRICSGSPEAEALRAGKRPFPLPALAELGTMSPDELAEVRRQMSASYAYRFPYRLGSRYYYVPDRRSPYEPVLADAPSRDLDGFSSPNHGGCLVQVLFQDGSVRVMRKYTVRPDSDLFKNNEGLPAAGCDPLDAVLGRSEATPGVEFVGHRR